MQQRKFDTIKYRELCDELPTFCNNYLYQGLYEKSPTTRIEYVKDLTKFFQFSIDNYPYYPDKNMNEITLNDFRQITANDINIYLSVLKDLGLSDATRSRRKTSVSGLYSYLINTERILDYNPVMGAAHIKVPKKDYVNYLTTEEQDNLLSGIHTGYGLTDRELCFHQKYVTRDKAIIFLFLDLGVRVSELNGMDIKDLNLTDCSVVVRRKGNKYSKLWYSDESASLLSDYLDERRNRGDLISGDTPLFVTLKQQRLSIRAIEQLVTKYVSAILPEKANIISCHKLRSSFAMSFYKASGGDILSLQRRLGHEHISTTNVYAKATDAELKANRNWR